MIRLVSFSVLMSVYFRDEAKYLYQALVSLNEQTYKADEVVIVEDGKLPEALIDIIDSFREELNIVSVKIKINSGLAIALNEGLKYCKYPLVARMDADDISVPRRFEVQLNEFKAMPQLDVLGGWAREIDVYGVFGEIRRMPESHEDIYSNLYACPFVHPLVMFRKSSILSIGGYDGCLSRRQDYDLWFRCAKAGFRFYNIQEVLLLYRFSGETHKRQSAKIMLKQALIGYKGVRCLNQPLWKALLAFFPLVRSLLPGFLEHYVYRVFKRFDPRQGSN